MESIYGEAPEGVETPEGWERFPAGVDQWFRRPLRGEGVVTNRHRFLTTSSAGKNTLES
jgi:hypothetical protein